MVELLFYLLIVCLVGYLFWWAINQIPLPPPVKVVVTVIFAMIMIVVLLQLLPPIGRMPLLR